METIGMKAYSKDLRLKVLDAVDRGMARKEEEVARTFGICVLSIKRWLKKRRRETGDVEPSPRRPGPPVLRPGRAPCCWTGG